jgi:hypothetical protein
MKAYIGEIPPTSANSIINACGELTPAKQIFIGAADYLLTLC